MCRPAWPRLGCLVLDGQWDEALAILAHLPLPGNAYLRREVTDALAVLARHRGEPEIAWEQIHALFPDGAATEPGDLIHQEGLYFSAWRPISAWTRATYRGRTPG